MSQYNGSLLMQNPYKMKFLLAALVRQCNLSKYEARAVIRAHRAGLHWSGEAVNHYGGVQACLNDAIKRRHWGNPDKGPQWLDQLISLANEIVKHPRY